MGFADALNFLGGLGRLAGGLAELALSGTRIALYIENGNTG